MDNKELLRMMMIKMENNHHNNNHNPTYAAAGVTDNVDQKSSSGFMDLVGFQDYYYSCFGNYYHDDQPPVLLPSASSLSMEMDVATSSANHHHHLNNNKEETTGVDEESSSVVLNGQQPSSPNSCSISTSPALHHQQQQQLHKPLKQCMKGKKTILDGDETKITKKKKKEKEAKFAFMTRSEIDHLDDGYRWRKYGQKAVKNSHFPRSYYKCTSASCNVKKRVERCMGDSSYVVTTYEGQHIHPPPSSLHTTLSNTFSFNHLINPATSAINTATIATNCAATNYGTTTMPKLDKGGLLQDMLPCHQ